MSWHFHTISDISLKITKGTTPKQFSEDGINYIKAEALNGDSGLNLKSFSFISENTHESLKRSQLQSNDVLVTIAGANIGKCGFVNPEILPANTNQAVAIVRADTEKACPRFIYYFFKSPNTFRWIQGQNSQAAQPNLNLATLGSIKIRLPDILTQKNISELLLSYDELIENNIRRIQLLEESIRLLYREWFVHLRFPGHEHVEINGGTPKGWSSVQLGEILTLQRGFDLPKEQRNEGTIPIYASTGVNGYHNQAMVKAPGVVTGRSGSLGTVMYVQENFWPLNTTLWVKEFKRGTPIFACYLLSTLGLAQYNGGVAVPTLNRNDVHRIEVLCPTEQLIHDFSEQAESIHQQVSKLNDYNIKLTQARDLLLPRLMNGEITI